MLLFERADRYVFIFGEHISRRFKRVWKSAWKRYERGQDEVKLSGGIEHGRIFENARIATLI